MITDDSYYMQVHISVDCGYDIIKTIYPVLTWRNLKTFYDLFN